MESPEAVAFALMKAIAHAENKNLDAWGESDREWILQTYSQCRRVVSRPNDVDSILSDYKPD